MGVSCARTTHYPRVCFERLDARLAGITTVSTCVTCSLVQLPCHEMRAPISVGIGVTVSAIVRNQRVMTQWPRCLSSGRKRQLARTWSPARKNLRSAWRDAEEYDATGKYPLRHVASTRSGRRRASDGLPVCAPGIGRAPRFEAVGSVEESVRGQALDVDDGRLAIPSIVSCQRARRGARNPSDTAASHVCA